MGRNRTRADNRNHGGRTAPRGKRDAAKVSKLAELARKLERTQQLPVGLMPLQVNQFKATGTLPRETKRVTQIIRGPRRQPGPVDRRVGPIERIQRAIEMAKKSMGVLAKLGFEEAKPYLEAGIQACDQYSVDATDFMGWSELTGAVMDHTFEKKRGFQFDGRKTLDFQVSYAQLANTNADGTYFPRPEGGEYGFTKKSNLFKHIASVKSASFHGSPNFPHDFVTRSTLFPLDPNHTRDTIYNFIHTQVTELDEDDAKATRDAILSISTNTDKMKYFDKPTSESVYTRDYEIIFNEVVGEMVFDHSNIVLKVEIRRKMATAVPTAICSEPGSQVIPLFEEATIYLQRVENTEYKYTAACLVFSSSPVVKGGLAHMHVIGDNAFTLCLGDNFKTSGDRHQKSMTNVGIVVGLLDKVERFPQLDAVQQGKLEASFEFLIDPEHANAKTQLQKVVSDKKKAALSAATNEAAKQAVENNYTNDHSRSSEASRLLSNSFLSNQLKKAAITTAERSRMPQVRHWISSATFSFITIQIEGTSRSYCFIQSFSPSNRMKPTDTTTVTLPAVVAPAAMKKRTVWAERSPEGVERKLRRSEMEKIAPASERPAFEKQNSVPSVFPYEYNSSSRSGAFGRRAAAQAGARYTSSLPPELELELELL
jgi:hypothetical protein